MGNIEAGNFGEQLVRSELQKINGNIISGFIRSKNICYYDRNFQIDFLLFVPKIGLVVLEVKNWKGTIKATSGEKWTRELNDNTKEEFNNASLQSLRTSGLLLQILEGGKINKWPIRPVVVFVHKNSTILTSQKNVPQTEIIYITRIAEWLEQNSSDEIFYKFSQAEFNKVTSIISQYTQDYVEVTRK